MKSCVKWILVFLIGGLFFSCAPIKKSVYLQKFKESTSINSPDRIHKTDIYAKEQINVGDELYITVISGNDSPNSFNQNSIATSDPSLISYSVNQEGKIRIPYLKEVKVIDLTVEELANKLESELEQYIYSPSVAVRIVNKRISILGEVRSPGLYVVNNNTVNIFQALALAGDISSFGNRKNVLIVRRDGDNIVKKYIDLTNDEVMLSSWYNIQSNDIIYVEPLFRKTFGTETFSVFSFISLVTSTISMYFLITTL